MKQYYVPDSILYKETISPLMQFTVPLWKQQKFIYKCPPVLQNYFISFIYHSTYIILVTDSIIKHNTNKAKTTTASITFTFLTGLNEHQTFRIWICDQ